MRIPMNVADQILQDEGLDVPVQRRTPEVFTHRHIVTSFICTFHGSSFEDFKVAIFKRSNKTHSHQ